MFGAIMHWCGAIMRWCGAIIPPCGAIVRWCGAIIPPCGAIVGFCGAIASQTVSPIHPLSILPSTPFFISEKPSILKRFQ
ncbi:hypothetical protein [Radiobacillus sp. PE A8.2]|uniref:hypothetical protein n=1 Tax=Radiobacillus sp. PE A8.2 TaxID=3380349 RepID=UPI0038906F6A